MSSHALVSICLPVFNGEKFLSAAIETVLAQSHANFELLVSDDGSTDESVSIAERYAAQDSRIKFWKNEQRLGLFGNYNETIRRAKGDFIKTYAQDDLLEPKALETMLLPFLNIEKIALISSARTIIDREGNELQKIKPFPKSLRIPAREVMTFNLIGLNNWVGEPSTVMFKREYAGTGFDTNFYHYGDIEYWFRILEQGDYYFIEDTLCSFRRHSESQTNKNHKELYYALDILRLSLKYRWLLKDIESEALFRRRISEAVALQMQHISDSLGHEVCLDYEQDFCENKSNEAGFRLFSSYALSGLTGLIAELDHEKRCRFDEHELFRREVEKMQNSLYWKLTSPLRVIRDAVKRV